MKKILLAAAIATAAVSAPAMACDDYMKHQLRQDAKISYKQAKDIARKIVGGDSYVTEIDFETKRGRAYYDVEVRAGAFKYDVYVDANTGKAHKKLDD